LKPIKVFLGQNKNLFVFIDFGLGAELETNQTSQPPAPLCPFNMAWKYKKWMKVGSKWKCKIGTCIITYSTNGY